MNIKLYDKYVQQAETASMQLKCYISFLLAMEPISMIRDQTVSEKNAPILSVYELKCWSKLIKSRQTVNP